MTIAHAAARARLDLHRRPQQTAPLFDHLVGGDKQSRRDFQAERLGGLEVDDQLEFRRLLYQLVGFGSFATSRLARRGISPCSPH
jgi:hypothetical protein